MFLPFLFQALVLSTGRAIGQNLGPKQIHTRLPPKCFENNILIIRNNLWGSWGAKPQRWPRTRQASTRNSGNLYFFINQNFFYIRAESARRGFRVYSHLKPYVFPLQLIVISLNSTQSTMYKPFNFSFKKIQKWMLHPIWIIRICWKQIFNSGALHC